MHISPQMNHYLTTHEPSKLSTSSHGPLHFESSVNLPDKHPPSKITHSRNVINPPPQVSDSYDGVKYQNSISYQKSHERFGTQGTSATFDDSLSIGQSKEQRWFSQWSRDQMESKEIPQLGVDGPLPSYLEEKRTSKTLPIFLDKHDPNEKKDNSKTHIRTFSSTYGMKENYPANISNLPQEFVSPRLYSNKGELFSFKGRKRTGRRKGLHEAASLRQTLDSENPQAEESSVERLYMTEQLHPYDLFSPKMDGNEIQKESKTRRKKKYEEKSLGSTELSVETKRNRSKHNKENEIGKHHTAGNSSKHWEISKSRGNSKYRDMMESEDYKRNKSFREPVSSKDTKRQFESKEYGSIYNDSHYEKLLKERDDQLKQMKKFYEQLYDNYVEVKGGLETIVEEKEKLMNSLNFQMSQNEALKEKLNEAHKKEATLMEENQQWKQNQMKRDELINTLETQVGKLKTEVAVWTKRYDDQSESYNSRIKRIERERHDLLDKKEKLEKSVEEYINHHEFTDKEDKATLTKHLEERTRQVKTLKRKNEELMQEVEKLNRIQYESFERQYSTERLMSTMGRHDTKRPFEETFNQTKGDRSQELVAELRKYKIETERLRAENESLKQEGRQTLRRFEELDSSVERIDERLGSLEKNKRTAKKPSDMGALGKVLREIMSESGVDNISEVSMKIKELQDGHKTNTKFVSGVLDLIYKCSPPGFFEGRPTVKQAWNWLKRFMEEYMAMKKKMKTEDDCTVEKEIVNALMECLRISAKEEIVSKVKRIDSENIQMKKALEKVKASGLESSFGLMEDKYKNSYGNYGYLHSTARFENQYSLTGKLQ